MEGRLGTCARALESSPANEQRRTCMGNQPAYSDVVVRLEAAALATGRLDAALSGHPLLPAWTFWSQLDTARRHAEGMAGRSSVSPRRVPARPAAQGRRYLVPGRAG